MTSYVPPKKNAAYVVYVSLTNHATGILYANPTIAAGDFRLFGEGVLQGNLATTPTVTPAGDYLVKISASASEMNFDNVKIVGADQTSPPEWKPIVLSIQTAANTHDELYTLVGGVAAAVWAVGTRTLTAFGTLVDDIHDEVVEGAHTFRQMIRLIAANLFGESAGGGTTTPEFKSLDGTKTRITGTVDESGNRSDITLDGS